MSTSTETPVRPVSQVSAPNRSMAGANGVTFAYRRFGSTDGTKCRWSSCITSALKIYRDAGHGFLFQYPAEFAGEVDAFLAYPKAAHEPRTFDGFVFPTRRRVHLHDADGDAAQSFAPITLDIDSIEVEPRPMSDASADPAIDTNPRRTR